MPNVHSTPQAWLYARFSVTTSLVEHFLYNEAPKRFRFFATLKNRPGPNGKNYPLPLFILLCDNFNLGTTVITVVNPRSGSGSFFRLFRVSPSRPSISLFYTTLLHPIKSMICPDNSSKLSFHFLIIQLRSLDNCPKLGQY